MLNLLTSLALAVAVTIAAPSFSKWRRRGQGWHQGLQIQSTCDGQNEDLALSDGCAVLRQS